MPLLAKQLYAVPR